jgi:hypothetical protein
MIPYAQLAIFPGADDFLLFTKPDKVLGTLVPRRAGEVTHVTAARSLNRGSRQWPLTSTAVRWSTASQTSTNRV